MKRKLLYKPYLRWVVIDVSILILSYLMVLWILPMQAQEPIQKYFPALLTIGATWLAVSYLFGRYRHHAALTNGYVRTAFAEFYTILTAIAVDLPLFIRLNNYSLPVLGALLGFMSVVFFLVTGARFAYLYASDPEIIPEEQPARQPVAALRHEILLRRTLHVSNVIETEPYRYDCIVEQTPLDNLRGINRLLAAYNALLPDGGELVCCFKDKSTKKREFLARWPKAVAWLPYLFYYLWHRICPKLFITKRLYYDITRGRHRVLSKTEMLGRLCYNGYEIVDECKSDGLRYVRARRVKNAPLRHKLRYGPIISLTRHGKGRKLIHVYKFRTMYPYSEFLQDYIYQKYNLQEGGKFNHDIRVNSEGRFMRRYWIDELPMLVNWLRGDLKLVGVRPLSQQYYNLYDKDLQELRSRFKPGLLPPFYVDMPKTLDEIQDSERKYLNLCVQNGQRSTDFKYFWKIAGTILFKHARSK